LISHKKPCDSEFAPQEETEYVEAIQEDVAWVCQVPMRGGFFLQNPLGGLSS